MRTVGTDLDSVDVSLEANRGGHFYYSGQNYVEGSDQRCCSSCSAPGTRKGCERGRILWTITLNVYMSFVFN